MDLSYLTPKRIALKVRVFFLKREYDQTIAFQKKFYDNLLFSTQAMIEILISALVDEQTYSDTDVRTTLFELAAESVALKNELIDVYKIDDLAERGKELQEIFRVLKMNLRQFKEIRMKYQ